MGKMFKINDIFEEKGGFFDNIVHSFDTSRWIFITETNIMCQILFRSDASKNHTHKKRYSSFS